MAGWLQDVKDTALGAAVRKFLGAKLESYGVIETLKIDSKQRKIEISLRLNGETDAVNVQLRNYEIADREGEVSVRLPASAFETSRAWITKLTNDQLADRSFIVPGKYAKYAMSLIG